MNKTVTTKTISMNNLQSDLNYIGIIEENNIRIIAGTTKYKNYEGIETIRVMHIVIYNTVTKENIYETGNNLRMDMDNLMEYAEDLMLILEKYIADSFYLNKFMDMFFYECKFMNIGLIVKGIKQEILEQQDKINREQTAMERKQLEKQLINACKDKQILIIENGDNFILVHDAKLAEKQDNEDFKKLIYKIIDTNTISNYRELDNIKIEMLAYTYGNMLDSNIKAIELLKRHIDYIGA
jgi:hypothetical protein